MVKSGRSRQFNRERRSFALRGRAEDFPSVRFRDGRDEGEPQPMAGFRAAGICAVEAFEDLGEVLG